MSFRARMNDRQRAVLATTAIALFVAALFYVPWRIETTGELKWAPFYRDPVVGQSTIIDGPIESRFIRLKGQPVLSLYLLQLMGIAGAGAVAYRLMRTVDDTA